MRPSFSISELRDMVSVDRYNLEEAAERQPELYGAVAEKYGQAYKLHLLSDIAYDRAKGILIPKVRQEMEAAGEKVTEATATAALMRHPEYLAAKTARAEADAMANDLKNLMFAYQQRGKAIDQLQQQLAGSFYEYRRR